MVEFKNMLDKLTQDINHENIIVRRSYSMWIRKLIKHHWVTPILYIISGCIMLFILLMSFYTYFLRLKIESAVVSAPIETIVAPLSGYITSVFVSLSEHVKKGQPLMKIENLDLERELQLSRVNLDESQLNIDYYQRLLMNEQQRLKIYQKIGHNRVVSAKTSVNIFAREVLNEKNNYDRFKLLYKKHYVSKSQLDAQFTQYLRAKEKFKYAKSQKRIEHNALHALDQGLYFTGNKAEGIERDLYAELEMAQKKVKLNENKVKIYENLIDKLIIRAPFDGKITQIIKSAGNTTDNIKPLIFIEKSNTNKNIFAYLTQDEITKIVAYKNVRIYIPASGKTYHGEVLEINRTEGFVDAVKAQYRWRDFQLDRSAMVTIGVKNSDQKAFVQYAFAGMPAMIYFTK